MATLVAVLVLMTAVLIACVLAWIKDRREGAIVPLAAGTALPLFTAAYLLSHWVDAESIMRAVGPSEWEPMSRVGEATFLALTVGLGGETVGLELAGVARAIAFLQILLTLAVVATALLWGWYQLTARNPPAAD